MIIDKNSSDKYNPEYDVSIRRFSELFAQTSKKKEAMGAALSIVKSGETVREHINKPGVEEVFLLLDGNAIFTLDDVNHDIAAGDMGFAEIGQKHSFTNSSDSTIRLLSIWWKAVAE
ncbi:MAG: cupin domain-containing protein [Ignavibacteriaceae bacterium]